MNAEIFVPMFYMVLLTFTVSLVGTIVRFKNVLIDKKHTGIEMMKFSPPSSASVIIKQADRNLTNLFEFPIIFYVLSVFCFIQGIQDQLLMTLSWSYIVLRTVHSYLHIFVTSTALRGPVFVLSNLVLFVMLLGMLRTMH